MITVFVYVVWQSGSCSKIYIYNYFRFNKKYIIIPRAWKSSLKISSGLVETINTVGITPHFTPCKRYLWLCIYFSFIFTPPKYMLYRLPENGIYLLTTNNRIYIEEFSIVMGKVLPIFYAIGQQDLSLI